MMELSVKWPQYGTNSWFWWVKTAIFSTNILGKHVNICGMFFYRNVPLDQLLVSKIESILASFQTSEKNI